MHLDYADARAYTPCPVSGGTPTTPGARIRALRGDEKPVAFIARAGLDIDQSTLGRYERDEITNLNAAIVAKIAAANDTTSEWILYGTDGIRPQPQLQDQLRLLGETVSLVSAELAEVVQRLDQLERKSER